MTVMMAMMMNFILAEILPSDFVPEMLIKVGRFTCDTRAATRKLLGKGNFAAVYRAVSEDGVCAS